MLTRQEQNFIGNSCTQKFHKNKDIILTISHKINMARNLKEKVITVTKIKSECIYDIYACIMLTPVYKGLQSI